MFYTENYKEKILTIFKIISNNFDLKKIYF